MKFLLMSDLHMEVRSYTLKPKILEDIEFDAVLLPGDIGRGLQGRKWAIETFPDVPILYTTGNHEYYSDNWTLQSLDESLLSLNDDHFTFLQNSEAAFDDHSVVVLGCTLWTDFRLNGKPEIDLRRAPQVMNDYNWIKGRDGNLVQPSEILTLNTISKFWLQERIKHYRGLDWTIVVMTHHAPTVASCHPRYRFNSVDNVYFANAFDMDYGFEWPDFWVHGHVHDSASYSIDVCRVICNPRGYAKVDGQSENVNYSPFYVFDTKKDHHVWY